MISLLALSGVEFADLVAGRPVRGLPVVPGGLAPVEVLQMLHDLTGTLRADREEVAWAVEEGGQIAALITLIAAPKADGVAQIGYGAAPACEGQGVTTRGVAALITRLSKEAKLCAVVAETHVDNHASQRVLKKNAFVAEGRRHDTEDGELIVWRRSLR